MPCDLVLYNKFQSENERIQNKTDELLQKAEDLKVNKTFISFASSIANFFYLLIAQTSIDSENEKINQKSDEMIHQIADLKV